MTALELPALDDREALRNFIEAMKIAESASRQLALYTDNQQWIKVGYILGNVRETATSIALHSFGVR